VEDLCLRVEVCLLFRASGLILLVQGHTLRNEKTVKVDDGWESIILNFEDTI
jgi:hypothetical protein